MEIKVLGTGSEASKRLYKEVEAALEWTGLEANLCRIERIDDLIKWGMIQAPALVIDGEMKSQGRVPERSEIIGWMMLAATREQKWGPVDEHFGDPA
jgi:small redox-active disulfide protein 2